MDTNCITDNCHVILQKGTFLKSCKISSEGFTNLSNRNKLKIQFKAAIGEPFGSTFQLVPTDNRDCFDVQKLSWEAAITGDVLPITESSGEDNRDLKDDGNSQKLSKEEIQQMQNQGASGEEVIQAIAANSATFNSKTKYSQEKYVAKKSKKYSEPITLHKPSLDLVADMLFASDPLKVSILRTDTLFQILSQCNVYPGGIALVYDSNTQSLITAGLVQRLGIKGTLVNVYNGNTAWSAHSNGALKALDFSKVELSMTFHISYEDIGDLPKPCLIKDSKTIVNAATENREVGSNDDLNSHLNDQVKTEEELDPRNNTHNKSMRLYIRSKKTDKLLSTQILSEGVETLVISTKDHPLPMVNILLPFLLPGCPFVVHCPHSQPLMEVYQSIKQDGTATNLKLTETWLREYQVLPERTHPDVNMSSTGGYLLTGTKIIPLY